MACTLIVVGDDFERGMVCTSLGLQGHTVMTPADSNEVVACLDRVGCIVLDSGLVDSAVVKAAAERPEVRVISLPAAPGSRDTHEAPPFDTCGNVMDILKVVDEMFVGDRDTTSPRQT